MPALHVVPRGLDLDAINRDLADASAEDVIAWAADTFGEQLITTSSFGATAALMLHLVARVAPKTPVIFLDTGYLFPETYQFAKRLEDELGLRVEVYGPKMTAARQEALYGRLWEGSEEDLARYQAINKVEPLQRALRELQAAGWIAGLRASQTEHRAGLRKVELVDGIYKVHPVLTWSKQDVADYFERHALPYHPLYAWGYRSIGDAHSTAPVDPSETDDRAGRDLGEKRECGIHLPQTPEEEASRKSSGL
jgi:phosphoadenosine phosphosulfate reductase